MTHGTQQHDSGAIMTLQCRFTDRFLEAGVSREEANRALLLLRADGADDEALTQRVEILLLLSRATGTLQNAKLAYSLATRAEGALTLASCHLLASALRCSDCVPAGVRLWKTALEVGDATSEGLSTAARLGEDGAGQIKILRMLNSGASETAVVHELARRLAAVGWQHEGSWGSHYLPERGLVWWDFASPTERKSFGMSLLSQELDLSSRLGTTFSVEIRHEILGTTDRCHLEVGIDGRRWEKLVKFEGRQDWTTVEVDLSRFQDEKIFLRFHVLSGGQREGKGMEVANPRLISGQVVGERRIDFLETPIGWKTRVQSGELRAQQSEVTLTSGEVRLKPRSFPTLSFALKFLSSSVYAEGTLEILNSASESIHREELTASSDWRSYHIALPSNLEQDVRLRFWSKFSKRRDSDGLYVRNLRLQFGDSEKRECCLLDGGFDDGILEKRALVRLLASAGPEEMKRLSRLRAGLPDLKSALALNELLENEQQVPALLQLFGQLKENAALAFSVLQEHAQGEDLSLQAKVLLRSGLDRYPSTRDYLGDGLLTPQEFELNCKLYLQLREFWSEEQARHGLSVMLTPIADEDFSERRSRFLGVLSQVPDAEDFFSSWEKEWR